MKLRSLITVIFFAILTAACGLAPAPGTGSTPTPEDSEAAQALTAFFGHLAAGEYAAAAALYGGPYEHLQAYNPALDPADHPALLQNACEINGFVCLPMNQIHRVERLSSAEVLISADFTTEDGEVFVMGPCCGATEEQMPARSVFEFRVMMDSAGEYKVMDLPLYVP